MPSTNARLLPCGDVALLVELADATRGTERVLSLERAVVEAALPGVVECVPGLRTLLVEYDPDGTDAAALGAALLHLAAAARPRRLQANRVELPVCFESDCAPDLTEVAAALRMTVADLVAVVCAADLRVALVGHLPGLPYLVGLPAALSMPRRATARPRVAAGSLGLAAGMACIYPVAAPGGWHLVGRTPVRLVRPGAAAPALLAPGDRVRLRAIDATEFARRAADPAAAAEAAAAPAPSAALRVVDAGVRTLIVDAGRFGSARLGISRGGAADPEALHLANALCGNPPAAAALEIAVRGPLLEVEAATCRVALAGDAPLRLERDGGATDLHAWQSHTLGRGDRLRVGTAGGALGAVLAVAGGIGVEPQLGSRSTCLRGGAGGLLARPLRSGDLLPLDPAAGSRAEPQRKLASERRSLLRASGPFHVLPGPQHEALDTAGWATLHTAMWRVDPRSDRTGVRLDGPRLEPRGGADVLTQACPAGAIQVSGDGVPTVLGVDRGTTGGYCIPAVIASVDLPRLGRLRPGDTVRLALIDVATAHRLRGEHRAALLALTAGCRAATLGDP